MSGILGLLDNTLTANYEYSRGNRDNFWLPNQIKLSAKSSIFCDISLQFLESTLNSQCSEKKKKTKPDSSSISEVID